MKDRILDAFEDEGVLGDWAANAIAKLAVERFDRYCAKVDAVIKAGGFEVPDDQPMMNDNFRDAVRDTILGKKVGTYGASEMCDRVAWNQITLVIEEYGAKARGEDA